MKQNEERALKEIKEELGDMKSVLAVRWPLLASIVRRARIISDPKISTARVNEKGEIRINLGFLKSLDVKGRIYVYCHEGLHIALLHCLRSKGKDNDLSNIACDCVVHTLLDAEGLNNVRFPFDIVTAKGVSSLVKKEEKEVIKLSVEEIYYLLEKHCPKPPFRIMKDISESGEDSEKKKETDRNRASSEEKIIQEGDPEAYKEGKTQKEIEKYWKEAIIQAVIQAKIAGKLPGEFERIIENLLKAKISWENVIKKEIMDGLGRNVISTWKRNSRRFPLLPGTKQLTQANFWCLPDTSGSITKANLTQFFSEIYRVVIINHGKGIIIPWDAKAYPAIELTRAHDLTQKIKEGAIKGGGGTVIAPVLKEVLGSMKYGDVVVVLTDGDIADLKEEETQKLLQKVAIKSSRAIFGTMNIENPIPARWRKIKIEI